MMTLSGNAQAGTGGARRVPVAPPNATGDGPPPAINLSQGARGVHAALTRMGFQLTKNTRYSINLAKRKGVVIDPRTDRDALQMFHRLLSELSRAKGFPARRFQIHYAIWRHFYFACMNRLRRLARRLMEERYDWTRYLAPLYSLYENLLAASG